MSRSEAAVPVSMLAWAPRVVKGRQKIDATNHDLQPTRKPIE
jgi:hypothetical protein